MNNFIENLFLGAKALSIIDYIMILVTILTVSKTNKYITILDGSSKNFMKIKGYSFKIPYNKKTSQQKRMLWLNYIMIAFFMFMGFFGIENNVTDYLFALWCFVNIINILIEEILLKKYLFISEYEFVIDGSTMKYSKRGKQPELGIEIDENKDFVHVSVNEERIAVAKVDESQKKAINKIKNKIRNKKDETE